VSVPYSLEPLEGRSLLSVAGATVQPQAPVPATIGTQFVQEGNTLTVQAQATDSNPGSTVLYSLSPNSPAGAMIDPVSGLFVWTPPILEQVTSITIRATDSANPGLTAATTFTVWVFDVPPTIQAGGNTTIEQGTLLFRTGQFSAPNPDTWTATVDYGDGSGDHSLALNPDHSFGLDHTYSAPGTYTVTIVIDDSQGGQGQANFHVQVLPPGAQTGFSQAKSTSAIPQSQSTGSTPQPHTTPSSNSTGGAGHVQIPLIVLGRRPVPHVRFHIPHKHHG
jgi:hypothetical protein